ncbi:1,2-phenylacetyl-CoA epoxidase subunit PaaD [Kitasatospora sp. CM 4170]|uniref:1,2-phenylacetyl-CoA epoxidase subunit PaaD n=1 Tax=Kitasatospora aburaviensis TaxID=67265 RepID=A0ABW1EPP4_9ACTN|nr:1,2-phenylacetyl-CoA epoxidase subunit PaaD [Kitasatospora sp. CM 4170]WNM48531.1 1,2-phenylacetyl-CoA epoxidase subunit PaaD [Kitasatospora sp. CM 4170]
MVTGTATARERAWAVAAEVPDPELPMLTLADLGVLAEVEVEAAGAVPTATAEAPVAPAEAAVTAWLTPTYSGCPAVAEMAADVDRRLRAAGYADVRVRLRLDPAWSTDLITAEGRRKLAEAGIAPPRSAAERAAPAASGGASPRGTAPPLLTLGPTRHLVACPLCGGTDTEELSRFGSTACKALWRCRDCREPFERVKEI